MSWPTLGKNEMQNVSLSLISLAFKKAIIYHQGLSYRKNVMGEKCLIAQILEKEYKIIWLLQ